MRVSKLNNAECAIYARYSSDLQRPESITDQIRKCQEYAKNNGGRISARNIYKDEAVSGVSVTRPGLQALLAASRKKPCPFKVILIDDTSRLSRRLTDMVRIQEQLNSEDIRLIAVSQGIDSADEQSELVFTVHGLVDSLYVKELIKKTHRGMEGLALRGMHTGGRCFGYDILKQEGGGSVRTINPREAEVVRRIFRMSARGNSLKKIAAKLNRDRVPSPQPGRGKKYDSWYPTAIREMLHRELYIGRVIWNRTKYSKAPGSNRRIRRDRPISEWKTAERPDLRIVDQKLWEEVPAAGMGDQEIRL